MFPDHRLSDQTKHHPVSEHFPGCRWAELVGGDEKDKVMSLPLTFEIITEMKTLLPAPIIKNNIRQKVRKGGTKNIAGEGNGPLEKAFQTEPSEPRRGVKPLD